MCCSNVKPNSFILLQNENYKTFIEYSIEGHLGPLVYFKLDYLKNMDSYYNHLCVGVALHARLFLTNHRCYCFETSHTHWTSSNDLAGQVPKLYIRFWHNYAFLKLEVLIKVLHARLFLTNHRCYCFETSHTYCTSSNNLAGQVPKLYIRFWHNYAPFWTIKQLSH